MDIGVIAVTGTMTGTINPGIVSTGMEAESSSKLKI
jgi:hypothetical protein